jgi:hypothetical protein
MLARMFAMVCRYDGLSEDKSAYQAALPRRMLRTLRRLLTRLTLTPTPTLTLTPTPTPTPTLTLTLPLTRCAAVGVAISAPLLAPPSGPPMPLDAPRPPPSPAPPPPPPPPPAPPPSPPPSVVVELKVAATFEEMRTPSVCYTHIYICMHMRYAPMADPSPSPNPSY